MKDSLRKEQPINIFYSYAHEDQEHQRKLSKYLASLRREGKLKNGMMVKFLLVTNLKMQSIRIFILLIS